MGAGRAIAALTVTVAFALTGCGGSTTARTEGPQLALVDADAHGALVIDGRQRTATGIRRDGTIAWRSPFTDDSPLPVRCLDQCPNAVLSGSIGSFTSSTAADPEPVLVVDGRRLPVSTVATTKRYMVTAKAFDDLVVAAGDTTKSWLEIRHGGATSRTAVGGPRTTWSESADGQHALAITHAGGGNEARWFDRSADGWRLTGVSTPVTGTTSCVSTGGNRALLLAQRPAVLDRDGRQRHITDLAQAGTCAWAASGGILASLTQRNGVKQAQIRVVDDNGTVTFRADVTGEVRVSADPAAPRVAYAADGEVHETDPRAGHRLRTITQAQSAKYDGAGSLVVAHTDGAVAWH